MFSKWFWLELRWATIFNGLIALIISSFITITLTPVLIYHLYTDEINRGWGFLAVTIEILMLAAALIILMVNALLLYGYYKSKYLLYWPWLIINAFVILLLGNAVVNQIPKFNTDIGIRDTDVALTIFTVYHIYSYIAIFVHYWKHHSGQHGEIKFVADANI